MIPVLFDKGTTDFTSNGLGKLVDTASAKVRQERNGKFELTMKYPAGGAHFDEISHSCVVTAQPEDGKDPEPFRIYSISKPIDGMCTIKAEHISYQLSHIPVTPFGPVSSIAQAMIGLKANAAEACPFEFWTDKQSAGSFEVTEPKSIRSCLGGTQGSILDAFGGGEYEFVGYTVKLYQHRGSDNGIVIRYGKNLTSLEQEEEIDATITGVYPFWKGRTEVEGVETDIMVTLTEKVLHSENAANFPYQRTVSLDCSQHFQARPTEEQLRAYAQSYIEEEGVGVPKVSWKISFVPLWQSEEYKEVANLERVRLCDTVTVRFSALGVDATAKVIATDYDVLHERYDSIELGDARKTFAGTVKTELQAVEKTAKQNVQTAESRLREAIDQSTETITGGLGGHVVLKLNSEGKPEEILIMDTDDIQTAVNVWRFNLGGLGHSHSGYDGPFDDVALTMDGKINANLITVGTLSATLIEGGVLKMGGEDNGNGVIEVYDTNNVKIGEWDKDGLAASGDLQMIKDGLNSGLGTAKYVDYMQVEGQIRWLDKSGFYSKLLNGSDIVSSYAVFPESRRITEQFYVPSVWRKTFCFAENGMTKGVLYFFEGDKNGFQMYNYGYGGADDTGLLEFTVDPTNGIKADVGNASVDVADGVSISGEDGSISAKGNGVGLLSSNCVIRANTNIYSTDGGIYLKGGERSLIHVSNYQNSPSFTIRSGKTSGDNWGYAELRVYKSTGTTGGVAHTAKASVNNVDLAFSSSSSRRYKHDIKDLENEALDPHKLLSLPVRQFEYNDDVPCQYNDMHRITLPGFIAEEVAEIYPSAVIHRDKDGAIESWDERRIIPGMLALIQEQAKKNEELEKRVAALERWQ